MKARKVLVALAMMVAALPVAAKAETLTNDMVVTLVQAGLGDDAVIAKIRASAGHYALSTDDLIALKKRGVPGPVIAAMIESGSQGAVSAKAVFSADSPDPLVPHPSGLYLLSESRMVRIDPTTSNQSKTGGILGYAFTGGIASLSIKAVIPNVTARVRTGRGRPTFYFYFDEATRGLSQAGAPSLWLSGPASAITSPNEFTLIRFDVKKDRRETRVGSMNLAGAKAGVMDRDRIAFDYEQVTPGVFKVTPKTDLAAGEYGFLYSVSAGAGPGMWGNGTGSARIFDFAVHP
ncbi:MULTISPECIES: hypothetical protein [Sphingobium]|uniref:hypothetical protein n=1 Tax=Sphingobium sp. MI1205 TaxID=407020 RepID=UPI00076FFD29|nr:hypothetical protein [Sphingobium sp. MI1205]AMK17792.1 hypothetical protein K663_07055 [Sphingobium sp. MI1205]